MHQHLKTMKATAAAALLLLASGSTQADLVTADFSAIQPELRLNAFFPIDYETGIVGDLKSTTVLPAVSINYGPPEGIISFPAQGPGLVPAGIDFTAPPGNGNAFNTRDWAGYTCNGYPLQCYIPVIAPDNFWFDGRVLAPAPGSHQLGVSFSVPVTTLSFELAFALFDDSIMHPAQVAVDIYSPGGLLLDQQQFTMGTDPDANPIYPMQVTVGFNSNIDIGSVSIDELSGQDIGITDVTYGVPEPSAAALLTTVLLGFALRRKVRA